jgi:hypothetical protein
LWLLPSRCVGVIVVSSFEQEGAPRLQASRLPATGPTSRSRLSCVPEARWILVASDAQYPFWAANGDFIYYVFDGTEVRARRMRRESGLPYGEPFQVFAPPELQLPTWLSGTAPVALPNALILVLADLRGDVWLMDLTH